jgi:hypothetical protein
MGGRLRIVDPPGERGYRSLVASASRRSHARLYIAISVVTISALACTTEFVKFAHCDTDADCDQTSEYTKCDLVHHACAIPSALLDMSMPDLSPIACTQSSQCSVPTQPICDDGTKFCRACALPDAGVSTECTGRDASRPLCSPTGACVECLANRDCIKSGKTCDTGAGACVPCSKNADCASGICGAGGVCADPSTLVYVNKSGVSCPGGTGQGTLDDPFCTIQAGLNQGSLQGKKVVVFSGTYAENVSIQTTTTSFSVNAVGIGQPTIAPTATGAAVKLANMGMSISVSLDGFVIQNATGASGVDCNGGSGTTAMTRLALVRSMVRSNAQYGIVTSKCMLSLDQTTVALNPSGGASLADSDVTIQNTVVHHNGMAASGKTYGGIFMSTTGAGSATIVNSTVVANATAGGALADGGISCAYNVTNILNTVLHSNSGGTGEINAMACPPDHSAFVGAALANMGTNNIDLTTCSDTVLFVDATNNNYTPKTGAGTCSLIDTGAASHSFGGTLVNAPAYDIAGTTRPMGGGYDIGAYESM